MKIAILNIYQKQVSRGAETYIRELSKRLSKKNEVQVISGNRFPPKRWPVLWRAFLDPQGLFIALFTLKKLPYLWREKFDVIIPTNSGWQPAFIRILTWLSKKKMVIPGFSGMGWDDRNNLWCFPDRFVALSTKAKKWAKKANPLTRADYIPGGVDINKFKPEGDKFKTRLKKPIILSVGALEPEKRMELVIKTVAKMKGASLLVVGDGEQRGKIRELGEKLLGNRFQLTKVEFKDMPKVYRAADVFTIASMPYYSFEIVLVEAMASGLPVVANKDEIRAEIVGNAGILVDPTDIDSYTKALNKVLITDWGNKPREQAEKFSWDKIASDYQRLFDSLIK